MTSSAAVMRQSIEPSIPMLMSTAEAGGIVVQVSELSIVQAALATVVMRPASAPGKRSAK